MEKQKQPEESDIFEPGEVHKLAKKIHIRARSVGVFADEYEMVDKIEREAAVDDIPLWKAAKRVENRLLEENDVSVDDMPKDKRQLFNWEQHAGKSEFDDTVGGFWIPWEEEKTRRERIKYEEDRLSERADVSDSEVGRQTHEEVRNAIKSTGGCSQEQSRSRNTDDTSGIGLRSYLSFSRPSIPKISPIGLFQYTTNVGFGNMSVDAPIDDDEHAFSHPFFKQNRIGQFLDQWVAELANLLTLMGVLAKKTVIVSISLAMVLSTIYFISLLIFTVL